MAHIIKGFQSEMMLIPRRKTNIFEWNVVNKWRKGLNGVSKPYDDDDDDDGDEDKHRILHNKRKLKWSWVATNLEKKIM